MTFEDIPQEFFTVFIFSVALTIIYFFTLKFDKHYALQVRVQFFIDVLLVSMLVWRSSDLTSPYITLYIVLIGVAGLFLSGRGTMIIALLCNLFFSGLCISTFFSFISSYSPTPEISKAFQIIGFHNVAFLIVGLLSAKLAEKHASGEKLREATKSLENLRALHERIVESIRSGLITVDLDGKIYTFNKTAEEITGYKSEEIYGSSIYSLFGNISHQIENAFNSIDVTETQSRYEVGFTTPDGSIVQLGYSISPLFAENGEKTGLIITFQDLTEIRTMEENVRRKDRLAAVGRVAAGLAHEIRNPLGAVRGAIQVLESQTEKNSSQAKLMDIILRESDRLNSIITNFLSYARPQMSNFLEIDVREAISDTITLLRHSPSIKENHILEADLPEKPVMMSADLTQLKQIFWNLSRNALQAMEDGGELKIGVKNLKNNRVRFIFSDTGCGMSREQVEQLFEPFSKSTTGGTGLGLSIVYQIIRDHNGTINVSSAENKGTKITVELPNNYAAQTVSNELKTAAPKIPTQNLRVF
ncbi:MAG: ATP-binding protein [Acidobacteriota bacterium]|nr:ATP-binding protein [Acidobacteriota bacterium]